MLISNDWYSHPYRRLLSIILVSAMFISCSAKTPFRYLDLLIAWSVDDYVNWNAEQQSKFDNNLDELLLWHQRDQMKEYSHFLKLFQTDLEVPLSQDVLMQRSLQMKSLLKTVLRKVEPDLVVLLSSLTDIQLVELEANLDDRWQKDQRKYAEENNAKLNHERLKRVRKFARRFLGRLTDRQEAILVEWNNRLENTRGPWLQQRKKWSDRLLADLQQRQLPSFDLSVNQLFVNYESLWGKSYTESRNINLLHSMNTLIELQSSMTEQQRGHLNVEINNWIKTFDELAEEAAVRRKVAGIGVIQS